MRSRSRRACRKRPPPSCLVRRSTSSSIQSAMAVGCAAASRERAHRVPAWPSRAREWPRASPAAHSDRAPQRRRHLPRHWHSHPPRARALVLTAGVSRGLWHVRLKGASRAHGSQSEDGRAVHGCEQRPGLLAASPLARRPPLAALPPLARLPPPPTAPHRPHRHTPSRHPRARISRRECPSCRPPAVPSPHPQWPPRLSRPSLSARALRRL